MTEEDPTANLPAETLEKIKMFGMSRAQRRHRRGSRHAINLDPVRFKGYDHAIATAERPWDVKAANRKRNKAARAARRAGR